MNIQKEFNLRLDKLLLSLDALCQQEVVVMDMLANIQCRIRAQYQMMSEVLDTKKKLEKK